MVRTYPEIGRKSLFANRVFTREIDELVHTESQALLVFLYRHQETPEFTVRLNWTPNSLAIWDNRFTQHRAMFDYSGQARRCERVTVKGVRPFFNKPENSVKWGLVG